ncbi:NlpC/P60 family protein [Nocardia sp. NPDC005746]|uniref:C40 family peptidase n=1 Tax=Nocardia sp. NPDC005746 TaxID=3157062 RepID=UPI00340628BC
METNGDRQKVRLLPRLSLWTLVTGVLGAAAIGAALFFAAGQAQAAPVTIPGIGAIDIPDEIAAPLGRVTPAIGILPPAAGTMSPTPESAIGEPEAPRMTVAPQHIVIAPADTMPDPAPVRSLLPESLRQAIVIPAIGTPAVAAPTPAIGTLALADPTAVIQAPAPESRTVSVAGLGTFVVPAALPPLTGIPGVTDSAVTRTTVPAVMPKTAGERAVEAARTKLGANYSTGGNGPDSFDCSGLVQWSYREAGVEVPRTSYSQLAAGTPVGIDELEPGDLVSYYGGGHSAMYLGDGKIIHASDYGSGVKVSPLSNMPVTGARRFQ